MLSWLLGCLCRCRPGARRTGRTVPPGETEAVGAGPAEEAAGRDLDSLRDVQGVGPKTVEHLREAGFRSVEDVRAASESTLARVPGLSERTARAIKAALA